MHWSMEAKWISQSHKAAKWQSQDSDPDVLTPQASKVALVVKNMPADAGDVRDIRKCKFRCLGWEDHLEEGMTTQSSFLA